MLAAAGCAAAAESRAPRVDVAVDWNPPFTIRGRLDDPSAVRWRLDSSVGPVDPERLKAATEAAAQAWNGAARGAGVGFVAAGADDPADVTLSWRHADDDPCLLFGHGSSVAHTGPMGGGTFVHLDADRPWSAEAGHRGDTLTRAIAHELGHVLGLDHSLDPEALMYPDTHADGPTDSDLAGLFSLYGGGADSAGDVVIESVDEGGRCAPVLRGVAPPDSTALTLFDADGDGDREVLVWRTDPAGFGAAMMYDFEPPSPDAAAAGAAGPRLVRTIGPTIDLVPLDRPSFLRQSADGRRWLLVREPDFVNVYGFDEHGWRRVPDPQEWLALDIEALLAQPGPEVLPDANIVPAARLAHDNLTDGRRVTVLIGDLVGDGQNERVVRLSPPRTH